MNLTSELGLDFPTIFKMLEQENSLTPMIRQYLEIKQAYSEYLLFYRMGDFYELFFDDAVKASKALSITLTKRGKLAEHDIAMCGVPFHACDEYLHKLIKCGFKIAICEQTESPEEAKKRGGAKAVLKREVVRLITAGTLTEDKLLEPAQSNFLLVIGHQHTAQSCQLAIAWIDISTGHFYVKDTDFQNILSDIVRIQPKEILMAESIYDAGTSQIPSLNSLANLVVTHPDHFFDSKLAHKRLGDFYKLASLEAIGTFSPAQLSAISASILYIEKTQINSTPKLMLPQIEQTGQTLFIDSSTRISLELTQTINGAKTGSLFHAINRTTTPMGARLLAARITAPLTKAADIDQRLNAVEFFLQPNINITHFTNLLKQLPDIERVLSRLSLGRGSPRDMANILQALEISLELKDLLKDMLLPAELQAGYKVFSKFPYALSVNLQKAIKTDSLPLLKRDGNFIQEGYSQELDNLRQLRDNSRQIIIELQEEYINYSGAKNLKIKFNNVLGYFIEVSSLQADNLTNNTEKQALFIHRQTTANAMRFTTLRLSELETEIKDSAAKSLEIEIQLFDELLALILEQAEFFQQLAQAIAMIDVSIGLAILAKEQRYCRPIVDNSYNFNIKAGRHPVVEQALQLQKSRPFIANNCYLSGKNASSYGQIWLVTGPNMGGKSTFLRQNALIALLAQIGSFVPADSAHIGVIDRLFSRVGAADDLAKGHSTFMIEMIETASILNQATDRSLVIFDEIGRGTSTFDGLSIAWATTEYLHDQNKCRALFATHFHELTSLTSKLSRLFNVTMKVTEWNDKVIFLHEVIKGTADRSYGIHVANLAGLPQPVLRRAQQILQLLEEKEAYKSLESLPQSLPLLDFAMQKEAGNFIDPVKANNKNLTGYNSEIESDSSAISKKFTLIEEQVTNLQLDELTPKQALELLYKLQTDIKNLKH